MNLAQTDLNRTNDVIPVRLTAKAFHICVALQVNDMVPTIYRLLGLVIHKLPTTFFISSDSIGPNFVSQPKHPYTI